MKYRRARIVRRSRHLDLKRDYVVLAWPALDQFSEWTLYSSIVHAGAGVHDRALEGVGQRRKGARSSRSWFLPLRSDRLAGVYVSTRGRDPLESQLPSAAAAIAAPLLAALAAQQGTISARREARSPERAAPSAVPPSWASVARVDLPFRRASIQVELRAQHRASRAWRLAGRWRRSGAAWCSRGASRALRDGARRAIRGGAAVARERLCRSSAAVPRSGARAVLIELRVAGASLPRPDDRRDDEEPAGAAAGGRRVPEICRRARRDRHSHDAAAGEHSAVALQPGRGDRVPRPRTDIRRAGDGLGQSHHARSDRPSDLHGSGQRCLPQLRPVAHHSRAWRERTRWFAGAVVAPDVGAGGGFSLSSFAASR